MSDSYGEIQRDVEATQWNLGDVPAEPELDFDRPFLPEGMVHTAQVPFLAPRERVVLSQIRAFTYLELLVLAEKIVVPFLMSRAGLALHENNEQFLALMSFGQQEAKHIVLFSRFARAVGRGLDPAPDLRPTVRSLTGKFITPNSLAIALVVLHIDALADAHARCAEQSSETLEPNMLDLLRLHAREEAHHLRLDRLLIDELIERSTPYERERAIQQYVTIVDDLHASFGQRADLDRRAFEAHTRTLQPAESSALRHEQGLSYSTTFLHRGLAHPLLQKTLKDAFGGLSPALEEALGRTRVPAHHDEPRARA